MLKDFISKQTTFKKTIEEKLLTVEKNISSLSEAQTSLVNKMAAKPETMENTFATAHAIQVTIDENVRLLAQLHARWEKESEIDRNNSVCTITTKPQVAPILLLLCLSLVSLLLVMLSLNLVLMVAIFLK